MTCLICKEEENADRCPDCGSPKLTILSSEKSVKDRCIYIQIHCRDCHQNGTIVRTEKELRAAGRSF
jgi:Zn finger protein HypA/HybF involved in hydrogenase expression